MFLNFRLLVLLRRVVSNASLCLRIKPRSPIHGLRRIIFTLPVDYVLCSDLRLRRQSSMILYVIVLESRLFRTWVIRGYSIWRHGDIVRIRRRRFFVHG